MLVDVRTFPSSRRYPHFGSEALCIALANDGIDYLHLPSLGGFRKPAPKSVNTGWRNASFRGFADYMQTDSFRVGLDTLVGVAGEHRVAYMCSEAVPWRCHRSLISDALTARGVNVVDIIGPSAQVHELTPFAHVTDGCVTYPQQRSEKGTTNV